MVDLQPESVEIAKLSLWLKTARKDQKLNNLDENVKVGNSLKLNWSELFFGKKDPPDIETSQGEGSLNFTSQQNREPKTSIPPIDKEVKLTCPGDTWETRIPEGYDILPENDSSPSRTNNLF